jgi:hypothetical protein
MSKLGGEIIKEEGSVEVKNAANPDDIATSVIDDCYDGLWVLSRKARGAQGKLVIGTPAYKNLEACSDALSDARAAISRLK